MIEFFPAAYGAQLEKLARAWLTAGASGFTLLADGRPVVSWPAARPPAAPTMCVEIVVHDSPVGELVVSGLYSEELQVRLEADAQTLSALLTVESDLQSMTEELVGTRDQLLALLDLTHATRDLLEIGEILASLAVETARLINAQGSFLVVEPPGRPVVSHQYPQPVVGHDSLLYYLQALKAEQEPLILDSEQAKNGAGWRNLLLVPVRIQNAIRAVIGAYNKHDGDFAASDVKIGRAIGEYAGAHLEKWLLHEQHLEESRLRTEMDLAQAIQRNLLPRHPPTVPGLDLWGETRSALQVGGDFFDFIWEMGDPFTFTVGDVSGKGLSAALLMAMTRIVLRTKTDNVSSPSPSAVISRCNDVLYSDFASVNRFVTIFIGQYEPASRVLHFANAGHAPVIYCPAGGNPRLLEADGMPVGVMPDSLSGNHHLSLAPGDVLVVATDGFSEVRNAADQWFGYDRLLNAVGSLSAQSARSIASGLYSVVNQFHGSHPRDDDQTVLVVKVPGAST